MMTVNRHFDIYVNGVKREGFLEAYQVAQYLLKQDTKVSSATIYKIKKGSERSWMSGYLPVQKITVKSI